jgi:regulator of sigma E protease
MILNIIIFIAVLALLVLVHEFGHFLAAKKFKMYVEEFGFGFPPKIKGWKKGETTWSINAIPLGGFVKIAGEEGMDADSHGLDADSRGLDKDQRGPDVNLHGQVVRQEESIEVIESETEEIIIDEKITEINKTTEISSDRYFSAKPIWQRIIVLISGVTMNFILGWLILVVVFTVGTKPIVVVSQVSKDSPAYVAGIKEGDKIVGYSDMNSFISYVNDNKGKEITLTVKNGQDTKEIKVTPRENVPSGEGPLGVGLSAGGVEHQPFFTAVADATKTAGIIFAAVYVMLFKLIASIFGGPNLFRYISGPVGIYQATTQATGLGIAFLANLVAIISLNLAALNIFPFPALDGGRVIFLIIEKIKGSPVKTKTQQLINGIGFGLLLALVLAASIQDIVKIFK